MTGVALERVIQVLKSIGKEKEQLRESVKVVRKKDIECRTLAAQASKEQEGFQGEALTTDSG
jgi:septation ring formation regulator EzrA